MCGLVGLAGDCTLAKKDAFTELLLVDVLRGHHSTGAAFVGRGDNKIMMEKEAVPSPQFIATQKYKDLIGQMGLKAMIGHNRYATIGEKNAANAHPFAFEGLVGAHNGTLDSWSQKHLDKNGTFGTDSETLYYNIANRPLKDVIGDVTGAWALTWFDAATDTMNILRNDKRPLAYAYSEDRTTLFWASEHNMLDWILRRRGIKLFKDEIYNIEPDNHYRWKLPVANNVPFDKPVLAKVEGYKFTYVAPTTPHTGSYWSQDGGKTYHYGSTKKQNAHKHTPKQPPAPKVVDTAKFRPPYKDAKGQIITKKEFEKLVSCGCVFCDKTDIAWGTFIQPLKDDLDGRKLFLCAECYEDDDVRDLVNRAL